MFGWQVAGTHLGQLDSLAQLPRKINMKVLYRQIMHVMEPGNDPSESIAHLYIPSRAVERYDHGIAPRSGAHREY